MKIRLLLASTANWLLLFWMGLEITSCEVVYAAGIDGARRNYVVLVIGLDNLDLGLCGVNVAAVVEHAGGRGTARVGQVLDVDELVNDLSARLHATHISNILRKKLHADLLYYYTSMVAKRCIPTLVMTRETSLHTAHGGGLICDFEIGVGLRHYVAALLEEEVSTMFSSAAISNSAVTSAGADELSEKKRCEKYDD
ncbi:hypothetical protein IQ06DRAFT_308496 [Phaeosphaeriaceae sp. SRC1lsM3a]|nr:hypothetical protein IQ06DRAFT_308496 [Stagonospora sp. SRC1lsM3a]